MDRERIEEISKDLAYWQMLGTRPHMDVAMELLAEVKEFSGYEEAEVNEQEIVTEVNTGWQFAYNNIMDQYEDKIGGRPASYITLGRLLALEGIRKVSVDLPEGEGESFYSGAEYIIDRVNDCAKNWGILIDKKKKK